MVTRTFSRVAPLVLIAGALGLADSGAVAGDGYGLAGCGLGSVVFGTGGLQISAATTNTTSFSQPFGISSGTSNCVVDSKSAQIYNQERFVAANLSTLSREMAQGGGSSVDGLATLMGCSPGALPRFRSTTQNAYPEIFAAPGAGAVLDVIREQVAKDTLLQSECGNG